jgi:catechol 2,3-dioxygenase-like lactoylglutathione lyase family enzyme
MKRFHVHVAVNDLAHSTRFYSAMFGMPPTVEKPDYAKWMLDDPRVNFAISSRDGAAGINHLGFQAESDEELQEIHARLQTADTAIEAEQGANCCYAKSDKYWVQDPSGIAWESFRSLDTIPFYGEHSHKGDAGDESAVSADANATEGSGCSTSCCPPSLTAQTSAPKIANAKSCCNV